MVPEQTQSRVGGIRTVVHILLKPVADPGRTGPRTYQPHRIDVQQQYHCAAVTFRFGAKDSTLPNGRLNDRNRLGFPVHRKPQIGRRLICWR